MRSGSKRREAAAPDAGGNRGRAARWVIAGAAVVAGACVAAGAADGATKSMIVPSKAIKTATALCEPRAQPVSGGFSAPGFDRVAGAPVRIASKLSGRGWLTTAFNFGDAPGAKVSHVVCGRPKPKVRARSASRIVAPAQVGSVRVTCGRRQRVISGGFEAIGFNNLDGPRIVVITSKRAGKRSWVIQGYNLPSEDLGQNDAPGMLIGYAYCQRSKKRIRTRRVEAIAPVTGTKTFGARCSRKTRPVSAGFDGNLDLNATPLLGSGVIESLMAGRRGWRFSAISISESPGVATGYLYCARSR